jgi:TonB family protein
VRVEAISSPHLKSYFLNEFTPTRGSLQQRTRKYISYLIERHDAVLHRNDAKRVSDKWQHYFDITVPCSEFYDFWMELTAFYHQRAITQKEIKVYENFGKQLADETIKKREGVTITITLNEDKDYDPYLGGKDPYFVQQILETFVKYPDQAKANNIQGEVIVMVKIDKNGEVVADTVVQTVHPLLDESARQAIYNISDSGFIYPGYLPDEDGYLQETKAWIIIPIKFSLRRK